MLRLYLKPSARQESNHHPVTGIPILLKRSSHFVPVPPGFRGLLLSSSQIFQANTLVVQPAYLRACSRDAGAKSIHAQIELPGGMENLDQVCPGAERRATDIGNRACEGLSGRAAQGSCPNCERAP